MTDLADTASPNARETRLKAVVFAGLLAVVALSPAPLGSNRDWAWAPLAGIVGLLLVGQAVAGLSGGSFKNWRALVLPGCLVAAVLAWIAIQIIGIAPAAWENPARSAARAMLPDIGLPTVALSVDRAMTGLMRLLTYIGVFLIAADVCCDVQRCRKLFAVIVAMAALYTLVAMLFAIGNKVSVVTGIRFYVANDNPYFVFFTGPFVNRNNYATYVAIAAMIALSVVVRAMQTSDPRYEDASAAVAWRMRLIALGGAPGLYVVGLIILVAGLLLSGSRGGWLSFCIGALGLTALLLKGRRSWWVTVTVLIVALVAIVLSTPAGLFLAERFIRVVTTGDVGREALTLLTLRGIELRPLLGWGTNSFEPLFWMFQPPLLSEYYDKAHNTYLETVFDWGVPAGACWFAAIALIAWRCLVGVFERRQHAELPAAGVAAILVAGVHSVFDFSLQIPAVAVTFAAVVGGSWAQSWSSRRP